MNRTINGFHARKVMRLLRWYCGDHAYMALLTDLYELLIADLRKSRFLYHPNMDDGSFLAIGRSDHPFCHA